MRDPRQNVDTTARLRSLFICFHFLHSNERNRSILSTHTPSPIISLSLSYSVNPLLRITSPYQSADFFGTRSSVL